MEKMNKPANQNVEEMKNTIIPLATPVATWVAGNKTHGTVGFAGNVLVIFNPEDVPSTCPVDFENMINEHQFYLTSILASYRVPHVVITPDEIHIRSWDKS